jgi:hypothetical protein
MRVLHPYLPSRQIIVAVVVVAPGVAEEEAWQMV